MAEAFSEKIFCGNKALVVGLGRSGIGAAYALHEKGADVFVQDGKGDENFPRSLIEDLKSKNINLILGNNPKDIESFDFIVLSPGVSPQLDFIRRAKEAGVEVIGELELAYRICDAKFVAITGTNGKTTTTSLVGEIFAEAGRDFKVGGNIGKAIVTEALSSDENSWLITETSSFQLETTENFRPVVSAILNLTPDHLNRHHTMDAYGKAKSRIFSNQGKQDFLVINFDNKDCYILAKTAKCHIIPFSRRVLLQEGVFVKDNNVVVRTEGKNTAIMPIDEIKLIGEHNLENVLAACGICYFAGIDSDTIRRAVSRFSGVPHRIEYCGESNGVSFYNDSKGTNVEATLTAILALKENIVLIAGGDGKGQNFDELTRQLAGRVKALILMGKDARVIGESASKAGFSDVFYCENMEMSVSKATEIAEAGDKILLSPACASWDMYDNFERRGDHFKGCASEHIK